MTAAPTRQGVMTDEARIRELLLLNLFVVWSDSDATTHGHEELNERAQVVLDN